MGKRIAIALTAVLLAALGATAWHLAERDRAQSARLEALRAQAAPLERERDGLRRELEALSEEYGASSAVPATEQLVAAKPAREVYTRLYPLLEEYGFSGVVALWENAMPGGPGMLSREELGELLEHGWTCCLGYEAGAEPDAWYRSVLRRLGEAGLDIPGAVYFPAGTYSPALGEALRERGFTAAVHHGEDGLPLARPDFAGDLWLPGARLWNYEGVVADVDSLSASDGNLAFTVSFSSGESGAFEAEAFANMLSYVKNYADKGKLRLCGFDEARLARLEAELEQADKRAALDTRRSELEEELAALDGQIHEIYAAWREAGT